MSEKTIEICDDCGFDMDREFGVGCMCHCTCGKPEFLCGCEIPEATND